MMCEGYCLICFSFFWWLLLWLVGWFLFYLWHCINSWHFSSYSAVFAAIVTIECNATLN